MENKLRTIGAGLGALALAGFVGSAYLGSRVMDELVFERSGLGAKVESVATNECNAENRMYDSCDKAVEDLLVQRDLLKGIVQEQYGIISDDVGCPIRVSSPVTYGCKGLATPETVRKYFFD